MLADFGEVRIKEVPLAAYMYVHKVQIWPLHCGTVPFAPGQAVDGAACSDDVGCRCMLPEPSYFQCHLRPMDLSLIQCDVLGTPLYMAPEMREESSDAGPAADIFSAGVVVIEMGSSEVGANTVIHFTREPRAADSKLCSMYDARLAATMDAGA
jgi:serine/threonine protein kinase